MNVISFLILPIESLMKYVLDFSFDITQNYGVAIILLSVVVNVLLLPIYLLAEKLQEKEILAKARMKVKQDEINSCFFGQERFMMTRTLYRINGYHPIMSLRSMLSLLIQIPFFFAAYHFLKNYTPFNEVGFLFIDNLLSQDQSIPFGRYHINSLPLVMTGFNIFSAKIYTIRKNPDALLSTLMISIIFLVLLYTSPAALVLYWTSNNVFSLCKNIVLRIKDSTPSTPVSIWSILNSHITTLFSKRYTFFTLIALCWGSALYCIVAYIFIPSNRTRGVVPNSLLTIATALLIISAVLFALYKLYIEKNLVHSIPLQQHKHYHIISTITSIASITSFVVGSAIIIWYLFIPEHLIQIETVRTKLLGFVLLTTPNILLMPWCISAFFQRYSTSKNKYKNISQNTKVEFVIFIVAVSVSAFIILVSIPSEIYASAPTEIRIDFLTIFGINMAKYLAIGIFSMLAYVLLRFFRLHRILQFYSLAAAIVAILLCTYSLLIPFDHGRMDHFQLLTPQNITLTLTQFFFDWGIIVSVIFIISKLFTKAPIYLLGFLVLFHGIILLEVFSPNVWNTDFAQFNAESQSDTSITQKPKSSEEVLAFSEKGKNLVVILLDMANGGHMKRMQKEYSAVLSHYDGFVWYPNSLSISTYTASSFPAMIGGWKFTPEHISKISGNNLGEKIRLSYDILFNTFQDEQYKIAVTRIPYYGGDEAQCSLLEAQNIACVEFWDNSYIGYWNSRNTSKNTSVADLSDTKKTTLLTRAALMRAVPQFVKRIVYDEGNWNLFHSEFKNQQGFNSTLRDWAFIDSMSSLSSVKQGSSFNSFKLIYSNITHRPYALTETCTPKNDVYPDEQAGNNYEGDASYYTFRCTLNTLAQWIQWLKTNQIYDNTKIILISDHGNDFALDPMNIENISPALMKDEAHIYSFSRAHIFLAIKDYGATHPLTTDNLFMSNADLSSIVLHSIDGYTPPPHSSPRDANDPTTSDDHTEFLPIYHTAYYNWLDMIKEPNSFEILRAYEVKSNIFKKEHWKKIK